MRRVLITCLLLCAAPVPLAAQESDSRKPPRWDARGVGPLPRMGITSLDVSDDGNEIAIGTIAAFGDPNVLVLDETGKIVRHYQVGQRWIENVAFLPGSNEILALCTMPGGKAGDHVEAFRLRENQVLAEKIQHEGPWFFHYGDHSNHPTMKLARARNATALLAGNRVIIYRQGKEPATARLPLQDPDTSVSLAVDERGWVVIGATTHESTATPNLFLIDPERSKPVWSRAANKQVEQAPALEKGSYGKPTLPDGTREEPPQRDEKVWAPLSVAIGSSGAKTFIAAADYQGWQRWVRSSATRKDDNQGLRFVPTKPTITVYDEAGAVLGNFAANQFKKPFWSAISFSSAPMSFNVSTQQWKSRGLAGQSIMPTDDAAETLYTLNVGSGKVGSVSDSSPIVDVATNRKGEIVASLWRGRLMVGPWKEGPDLGGPALVRFGPDGKRWYAAGTNGIVSSFEPSGKKRWQIDLNKEIRGSPKPWVANARATPIVPGVWQIPGGRVESDLGGQRVIEAPEGLILIEGHAGLSFEREWNAMEAVGLDPRKVKYILATHEHGDHAPGAYLWRVVTGAKFVCSEEMAYTLQHHIPGNTGYGLHPPVPTDLVIKDDQELDLAGLKVRAIRIPGHTAGSMAWHFEKSGKSFVAFGDLIMPRGVLGYSGSVNFSARDALNSLKKLDDLKVDLVLPGHGAVEGPGNYFQAGIDVGQAVGWGFIKPERPDPRFRITQQNVLVVGWGQNATSAAFGDLNGDGKPDVVIVAPDGAGPRIQGSIVKFFLNHGGKFKDAPDYELKVPQVDQPHKIRVTQTKAGPFLLVAGKTAALLVPSRSNDETGKKGALPAFAIVPFDLGDGNHLRFIEEKSALVSRRFGGFYALDLPPAKASLRKWIPDIDGPYVDFRLVGNDLLTSYSQLYRRTGDKFPTAPAVQMPRDKDWSFLAVGDFNGDGKPDAVFLSYGMDKLTSARIFYGRGRTALELAEKEDVVLPLNALLLSMKKNQSFSLVRDNPAVADWDGDGIDDLVVAHGQSDEVLVFLGGKEGLSQDRVQRIALEYRVHYEHGIYVGDFDGHGRADLAVFGYTNTGVGSGGPPAVYIWLQ